MQSLIPFINFPNFPQIQNPNLLNMDYQKGKIGNFNDVIDLIDDDDDCIFVKSEKSRGNDVKDPIFIDGFCKKEKINDIDLVLCVDDYDDNDEIRVLSEKPMSELLSSIKGKRVKNHFSKYSVNEIGESSGSKSFVYNVIDDDDVVVELDHVEIMFCCEICADTKPRNECFKIKGCCHSYCYDCMRNYVASKLQDGVSQVVCPVPGCPGLLEPEYCREILPFEVFDRWGTLLCESVILACQKFYCPFKDCSALLLDDGSDVVTQSECPSCFRLFCAQCKVGWHDGIACDEYQKLNKDERQKDDIMLRNLAKHHKWQRCPACKYYVERKEGCLYMKCRCGIAFCYSCGEVNNDHRYHHCKKCSR